MTYQQILANDFRKAIELEQKCDTLLTMSYLDSYSPKTLALFGLAIINLVLTNMRTGLGGKTIIETALDPALSKLEDEIPTSTIRVGDIVKLERMTRISSKPNDSTEEPTSLEGVVVKLTGKLVSISVDEHVSGENLIALYNNTGNDNVRMWLVKLTNSITYKRALQAMTRLAELKDHDKGEVLRMLLGEIRYSPRNGEKKDTNQFFDPTLNNSQKSAVAFSIDESPVTIIHGPPGTGKTYTLIELIKQLTFNHGERVLVCGASNISVDNILERLSPAFNGDDEEPFGYNQKRGRRKRAITKYKNPEKLIRIGHPARLLQSNLQHSLDVLSKSSYSGSQDGNQEILRDIEKSIGDTLNQIRKCKRYSERRALWAELKDLKRELRQREKKAVHDLLINAKVILATLHGAGSNELFSLYKDHEFSVDNPLFHTIIIDEVSQSLEPQCWIPLTVHLGCKRLVIAGDNMQLPATVKSKEVVAELIKKGEHIADLEVTLFDRLVANHDGQDYLKLLDVQYRMNAEIMEFPSKSLYEGKLKAASSVENISLPDLANVGDTDASSPLCLWYDTQGGDFPEQASDDGGKLIDASAGSKYNEMEALVVLRHVEQLIEAGVQQEAIGIISPYSAQISTLKKTLNGTFDEIEISTVDGFQGREKEAIILSLVRSNDNREIGFLSEPRRLNVAMTRSKRQLCVVGDLELLDTCGVAYLRDWAKFVDSKFEVRYPDLGDY